MTCPLSGKSSTAANSRKQRRFTGGFCNSRHAGPGNHSRGPTSLTVNKMPDRAVWITSRAKSVFRASYRTVGGSSVGFDGTEANHPVIVKRLINPHAKVSQEFCDTAVVQSQLLVSADLKAPVVAFTNLQDVVDVHSCVAILQEAGKYPVSAASDRNEATGSLRRCSGVVPQRSDKRSAWQQGVHNVGDQRLHGSPVRQMNQHVAHAKDNLRALFEVTPELQDIVTHDSDWNADCVLLQFGQQIIAEVYCNNTKTGISQRNGMTARTTAQVNGKRS